MADLVGEGLALAHGDNTLYRCFGKPVRAGWLRDCDRHRCLAQHATGRPRDARFWKDSAGGQREHSTEVISRRPSRPAATQSAQRQAGIRRAAIREKWQTGQ